MGSIATAFVIQKAELGALLRAFRCDKAANPVRFCPVFRIIKAGDVELERQLGGLGVSPRHDCGYYS
jgi:hypothetical protein